jgi:hypothetical protein
MFMAHGTADGLSGGGWVGVESWGGGTRCVRECGADDRGTWTATKAAFDLSARWSRVSHQCIQSHMSHHCVTHVTHLHDRLSVRLWSCSSLIFSSTSSIMGPQLRDRHTDMPAAAEALYQQHCLMSNNVSSALHHQNCIISPAAAAARRQLSCG